MKFMSNIKNKMTFFDITNGTSLSGEGYGIESKVFRRADNIDLIFDSRGKYLGIRTCRGKIVNGRFTGKRGIYDFKSFMDLQGWKDGACLPLKKVNNDIIDDFVSVWKER